MLSMQGFWLAVDVSLIASNVYALYKLYLVEQICSSHSAFVTDNEESTASLPFLHKRLSRFMVGHEPLATKLSSARRGRRSFISVQKSMKSFMQRALAPYLLLMLLRLN